MNFWVATRSVADDMSGGGIGTTPVVRALQNVVGVPMSVHGTPADGVVCADAEMDAEDRGDGIFVGAAIA